MEAGGRASSPWSPRLFEVFSVNWLRPIYQVISTNLARWLIASTGMRSPAQLKPPRTNTKTRRAGRSWRTHAAGRHRPRLPSRGHIRASAAPRKRDLGPEDPAARRALRGLGPRVATQSAQRAGSRGEISAGNTTRQTLEIRDSLAVRSPDRRPAFRRQREDLTARIVRVDIATDEVRAFHAVHDVMHGRAAHHLRLGKVGHGAGSAEMNDRKSRQPRTPYTLGFVDAPDPPRQSSERRVQRDEVGINGA